ncbi:NAD-dependent epimerase/dehydratase family protein [Arenicella xantha]|uniref:Uncharacterized protein YbjT (DUF2867 family) n=1 Tax=Arenicella xantha TaxID=644221 RepID=A0A395JGK5_9GAMM|nr:NAD-dependent epimerase/dehydratase family protein [Arenicella xantha]RBP48871.1 uncharacterized protein YbjT (DUF2867 family) [Arenicella xantha]
MVNKKVLVLGGKGFIGRHAVASLTALGCDVTVGTRSPKNDKRQDTVKVSQPSITEEQHLLHRATTADEWLETAQQYDAVLNCVGILRQRIGESYEAVHHLAPMAIAAACQRAGTRFVHVSALGLSANAKSRFLSSKHRGEEAISSSGSDWIIAKISLLDGEGGYGATWLRGVAKLPLFIIPTSAKGKIAALTADDAGMALSQLCVGSEQTLQLAENRVFELGGEQPLGFEAYIRGLRLRHTDKRAWCVPIPGTLARLGAHICDVLHFSPFSFGHWELLCRDNIPKPNRLKELLGREPTRVV